MSSALHIDGLLKSVGEEELKGMFSKFGNVLSVNVKRPDTALSLCVGAVEMASLGEAAKAVIALHRSYWVENSSLCPRSSWYKKLTGTGQLHGEVSSAAQTEAGSLCKRWMSGARELHRVARRQQGRWCRTHSHLCQRVDAGGAGFWTSGRDV